jgi:hypothetical protein
MSNSVRMKEALDNAEANVELLATFPDYELSEKLDTIHIQMDLAEAKKNTESLELLEIWRSQVIAARIYKAENNIPDAPNEIEMAIADIETTVAKAEERAEIIEDAFSTKSHKTKIKEDNSNQTSLF